MDKREKYENALFTIRFSGEELKTRGVSIYDLSNSLLAIQRIVHKAHLSMKDKLLKGAFPNEEDRQILALQISERRRSSDSFGLIPMLLDLQTLAYLKQIAGYIIPAIIAYYTNDVLDYIRGEKNKNKQIFTASIYTEVVNIVTRVGASGSVETISLGAPTFDRETIAAFNYDTKIYLKSIQDEYFLGDYQTIKGRVYKFYPASNIVAIHGSDNRAIAIFLSNEDFHKVRYHRENRPLFLFRGHPRYRFGVETISVSEFEADEIEHIDSEEDFG